MPSSGPCRAHRWSRGHASTATIRVCSAVIGWMAWARRIVSGAASDSPRWRTLPARRVAHGSHRLLDRRLGVHAVLVVQVDVVGPEPPQRRVARASARTRAARSRRRGSRLRRRSLPNFVATTTRSRRPARARPTSSSLVNGPYMSAVSSNVDAEVDGAVDRGDRLAFVPGAVELAHAHAAEALGGDGEALTECPGSHPFRLAVLPNAPIAAGRAGQGASPRPAPYRQVGIGKTAAGSVPILRARLW